MRQLAALVAIALVTGCMNGPRNGQTTANKGAPIVFAGYWSDPSTEVKLFVQNSASGWDAIAHAPIYTGTSALKDNAGTDWYPFSVNDVVIPAQYWSAGGRANVAHVKASINGVQLTTFDVNADGCIQSALNTGGFQVIHDCRSSQSPVATINASCGAVDGDCCLGSPACDSGNQCRHNKCVVPCGQLNQGCCKDAPWCDAPDTACAGGACKSCGLLHEPCCGNGCKPNNGSCVGGTCQCGAVNQACCPGHSCNGGAICLNDGLCHQCGGLNQLCCANNSCSNGTCVGSSPPQCACGQRNEKCCPGSVCYNGTQCQGSGVCGDPDTNPPQCVPPGGACATSSGPFCCAGSLCTYGTCKSCIPHQGACGPGHGDLCCSWQDRCVLDQFTETEQCNIPDANN
ncbi:MAG: hypothetical protein ACXVDD_21080 [Polyangia bacterium]